MGRRRLTLGQASGTLNRRDKCGADLPTRQKFDREAVKKTRFTICHINWPRNTEFGGPRLLETFLYDHRWYIPGAGYCTVLTVGRMLGGRRGRAGRGWRGARGL